MAQLRYRFSVLGRHMDADTDDIQIDLAVAAGTGEDLAYTSTMTMTEWEWRVMVAGLRRSGVDVRVDDPAALARTA